MLDTVSPRTRDLIRSFVSQVTPKRPVHFLFYGTDHLYVFYICLIVVRQREWRWQWSSEMMEESGAESATGVELAGSDTEPEVE